MSDNEKNLELWNQLAPVTKEFTKTYKRAGGFSGTDVNPQWRIKRLTEVFGTVGKGWGWVVDRQWSEDFEATRVCFAAVSVWYLAKNESGTGYERYSTGIYTGGTVASRTPDEAYKMAITDAIGKCAATIGLAADVYMGEHEVPKIDYATPAELETLKALIEKYDVSEKRLLKPYGAGTLTDLSSDQVRNAAALINQKYNKSPEGGAE